MKKIKSKILASLFLSTLLVPMTSCIKVIEPLTFTVLTSSGSMTIPFAHWFTDTKNLNVMYGISNDVPNNGNNSDLKTIADNLLEQSYDVIVYDVYQGIDLINSNNLNYKLARVLNTGNYFLMDTNSTIKKEVGPNTKIAYYADLPSDINAYSSIYLENIIRTAYKNEQFSLTRLENVNVAYNELISGESEYDFIFMENPRAQQAIEYTKQDDGTSLVTYHNEGNYSQSLKKFDKVNASLRDQISLNVKHQGSDGKYYDVPGFPDKGLFINSKFEDDKYKGIMENFLFAIDNETSSLSVADYHVYDKLYMYGDENQQKTRLGITAQQLKTIQAGTKLYGDSITYNLMNYISPFSSTYNLTYIDLKNANVDFSINMIDKNIDGIYSRYYKFPEK